MQRRTFLGGFLAFTAALNAKLTWPTDPKVMSWNREHRPEWYRQDCYEWDCRIDVRNPTDCFSANVNEGYVECFRRDRHGFVLEYFDGEAFRTGTPHPIGSPTRLRIRSYREYGRVEIFRHGAVTQAV